MCRGAITLITSTVIAISTLALSGQANAACVLISNVNQLQAMRNTPDGDFCLAHDIDASSKPNFIPVGDPVNGLFTGNFNGRGFAIRNLTIHSGATYVGLFGMTDNAVITNVSVLNVDVASGAFNSSTGGLVGLLDGNGGATTVSRVHVGGSVKCTGGNCRAGGIIGATNGPGTLTMSSSAATVTGIGYAGGAIANPGGGAVITRTYATGAITCTGMNCFAGGLVGRASGGSVVLSFATGPVTGGDGTDSRTGGLIALTESGTTISRSYAAGRVSGGNGGYAAGLIAQHNSGDAGTISQTYSVGPVSSTGATVAGLIANVGLSPSIVSSYWDTDTSGQATSAAGTAKTTAQLRTVVAGFGTAWDATDGLSYPFLVDAGIDFRSPLATLVQFQMPYVFLPIGQFDDWEYLNPPAHADQASLAAVYTMIARAVGITDGDTRLDDVKIDRYFWDDATQTASWKGPVRNFATLGPLTTIPTATPLDTSNVIDAMDSEKLVILRGIYRTGGTAATHWMLGTLYTGSSGSVIAVYANDPATPGQVQIDPTTKHVVAPAGFPLTNFRVTAYRTVTLQLVVSDRRLKRDIVEVARLDNGLHLYRYRYLWSKQRYVGVMAQEVAAIRPAAVAKGPDGYLRVNYARLGMHLQTWKQWLRSAGSHNGATVREARVHLH